MEITTMKEALQIHAQILKSNENQAQNVSKLFSFSALSPSGSLAYARLVLNSLPNPNSYYFNTMIRAYSVSSDPIQALSLFCVIHIDPFSQPDKFTYPFLFKSCGRLNQIWFGKQLHGLVMKSGLGLDRYIQNSMIHMYSLCGESSVAYKVFDKMSQRDVVSWTSMIDGLVDDNRHVEAMRLFEEMVDDGIEVNDATVVSVLRACADTGGLGMGRRVHEIVRERNIGLKANVSTTLIDMYAKCGCIGSARQVFHDIVEKDVFVWTAMISGLASHGQCIDAIELFNEMLKFNVKPDERTITAVLTACRNAGWIREGKAYFRSMRKKYGMKPTIQHYGCIVDLLARAGHLKDAEEFIRNMAIKPDAVMWRTLIWGCKFHGDIDRGERLMKHVELLQMDSVDCGSHILIGNLYALAGKWRDKANVRALMHRKGLVKPPGSSKIEVDGKINEFSSGDTGHTEAENIYEKLNEIEERLIEEGHCPKVSEVLLEIDDEEKAFQLQHHSERLAVAFGLIKTSSRSDIRIVKNLRSCEDCHNVMKLISKIYQREIIVRDRIRFHYFRNGNCSCKDYW